MQSTIERVGISEHCKFLSDRSILSLCEQPLAEIVVPVDDEHTMPGWLIYNRSTETFWEIIPYSKEGRIERRLQSEAALDILSIIYSQSVH